MKISTRVPRCVGLASSTALVAMMSAIAGCGSSVAVQHEEEPTIAGATEPALDPGVRATLLDIAYRYKSWDRVSDAANWAPELCRVPPPSGVLVSESMDKDTHGRKLYFLFAKDGPAYSQLSYGIDRSIPAGASARSYTPIDSDSAPNSPVGQVLVKESWHPVEIDPKSVPVNRNAAEDERNHPDTYAFTHSGKVFTTGEQGPLFIMYKVDPATPGTDEGWIYATMTADRTQVTSAGRVESCMACHTQTPKDRLFGFRPRTPAISKP